MSSVMERIVRPVQTEAVPRRLPLEQIRQIKRVVVRAGKMPDMKKIEQKMIKGTGSHNQSFYCQAAHSAISNINVY